MITASELIKKGERMTRQYAKRYAKMNYNQSRYIQEEIRLNQKIRKEIKLNWPYLTAKRLENCFE